MQCFSFSDRSLQRSVFRFDLHADEEITLTDDTHLLSGKVDESLMAETKSFSKSYYKATTIKERINLKAHRQKMPKRFWKYLTEKQ